MYEASLPFLCLATMMNLTRHTRTHAVDDTTMFASLFPLHVRVRPPDAAKCALFSDR